MQLAWDKTGQRFFEAGLDKGVLYPSGSVSGVAWNGLISIERNVSGGETEAYYIDGIKYFDSVANEDFQATLTAFTYPDEFSPCLGLAKTGGGLTLSRQPRQTFGLAWRTKVGNDIDGIEHSSRIHIVYGATAAPSSKSNQTISDSPTPVSFEWTINAVPVIPGMGLGGSYGGDPDVDFLDWMWPPGFGMPGWPMGPDGNTPVPGWKATPYIVIEEKDVTPDVFDDIIDRLNGTPETLPYLPSPLDMINLLSGNLDSVPPAPLDPDYVPPVDPNPGDGNGVPESAWANAASVRPYQSLGRPGGNDNFYAAAVTGGDLSLSDDNVDTFIAFGPYIPPTTKIACADARFHKLPFVPKDIRVRFNVSLNLTLRDRHITPVLQLGLSNMDNTEIILSDTSQSIDMFGIQTDPVTGFDYIEFTFHGWNNTLYPDAWAKVLSGEFYAALNNQTIDSGDSNSTPDFWIHEMWLYYSNGDGEPSTPSPYTYQGVTSYNLTNGDGDTQLEPPPWSPQPFYRRWVTLGNDFPRSLWEAADGFRIRLSAPASAGQKVEISCELDADRDYQSFYGVVTVQDEDNTFLYLDQNSLNYSSWDIPYSMDEAITRLSYVPPTFDQQSKCTIQVRPVSTNTKTVDISEFVLEAWKYQS